MLGISENDNQEPDYNADLVINMTLIELLNNKNVIIFFIL